MSQNRRDFLKTLGLTAFAVASPIELFLDGLVTNILSKAVADEAQAQASKYILIQQYAAPPRWMFDLFLSPYGAVENNVAANGSVGSELTTSGGRYTGTKYATYKVKGINAPLIWTQDVANGSGANIPLSNLMDNMIVLQGIDALNPGHAPAGKLVNRPLTQYSIDGVLADQANLPFSGISFGSSSLDFKSALGKNSKHYTIGQDFAALIPKAFEAGISDVYSRNSTAIDNAILKLNNGIAHAKLGGQSLAFDQSSAKKLMLGEINKIQTEYPKLLAKYETIISATVSLSQNLPGYTDKPVGKTGDRTGDRLYCLNNATTFAGDADMRTSIESATIFNLAKQFAITEYSITNNLTSSASLNVDNLRIKANGKNYSFTKDQHNTGAISSIFYMTLYYRIMSACMLGLIDGLKNTAYKDGNMFDHTVIRSGSEFGRHPRTNGTGSDHSPWSSNCMLLSGMIKGPIVAGQIVKEGLDQGRRAGSWGLAGALKHGPTATTGHVISTLATILGVTSPSVNNPSLVVKNEDGSIVLNENYISKTEVV